MKQAILDAAVQIADRKGFRAVTRIAVAERAKVAEGTVSYHFKSMARLRDAIVVAAVKHRHVGVLAKALADGHRLAKAAPKDLKDAAAKLITG
jgi:AcrR family transcriptional regulator